MDTGGRGRGRKGVPAWAWGTLASEASLAPWGWTSGSRMKGAQYYTCQRRGLAWHPFSGCPENDCPQEQQVGCAHTAASRALRTVLGELPTKSDRDANMPFACMGMRWCPPHSPHLSFGLHWPPDLGTPLCCAEPSSPSCMGAAGRRGKEHLQSTSSTPVPLKVT